LEVPCHFKSVVRPDAEKATLGLRFAIKNVSAAQARRFFCGAQLRVSMKVGDADQLNFEGMEGEPLEAIAGVKSHSTTPKAINTVLHFEGDSVNAQKLVKFASEDGIIRVTRIGNLNTGDGDADGEDESTDPLPFAAAT
jgi:hypothetical protein